MLNIKRRKGPVEYSRKWFARAANPWDFFRFVSYVQFQGEHRPIGLRRKKFQTQLIDLTKTEEEIFAGMKKNTCYEIRRTARDGATFTEESNLETFRLFFNLFALKKSLPLLTADYVTALGAALQVTKAEVNNEILVMHAYLVDRESSRARLFLSANTVTTDQVDRSIFGRANRGLHWYDMRLFRDHGYSAYDMGGITIGDRNESTRGIDEFKMGFGGSTVCEDQFDSPLAALVERLSAFRKMRDQRLRHLFV